MHTNSSLFCFKCREPALRDMLGWGAAFSPSCFYPWFCHLLVTQDWNFFTLFTKCYRDFFLLIFIIFSFPLSFYAISLLTLDLCCCDGFLLISQPLSQFPCLTICSVLCRLVNCHEVTPVILILYNFCCLPVA